MRKLWVYKCNARGQWASGDWALFFDDPDSGEWGNTRDHIHNPAARKIAREEMQRGDLVLAYQTDRRTAIGLCEVVKLKKDADGEVTIFLKPLERFPEPVPIHDMKRSNPGLREVRALRPAVVQALYETSPEEARTLLEACGAATRLEAQVARPAAHGDAGAGFGDYASNVHVEKAAIRVVTDYYEKLGYDVRSAERERCGYDLRVTKGRAELHVEVKGVRGSEPRFLLTAHEYEVAASDPLVQLAVVTGALSDRPRIRVWTGTEVRERFEFRPVQYAASLKPRR
ncbi:MAG: protein NO VEIN domain-containing protein [Phycisphaerae bacterium]